MNQFPFLSLHNPRNKRSNLIIMDTKITELILTTLNKIQKAMKVLETIITIEAKDMLLAPTCIYTW